MGFILISLCSRTPPGCHPVNGFLAGIILKFICLICQYGNQAIAQAVMDLPVKSFQKFLVQIILYPDSYMFDPRLPEIRGCL